MTNNYNYPLRENAENLQAFSGRQLHEIHPDSIAELNADDLRTHADTLRQQAKIAADAGFRQLAANLRRAAELTQVPNEELLKIYEMLRPQRATHAELIRLADYLEAQYEARENATMIRQAANVYQQRGILRR